MQRILFGLMALGLMALGLMACGAEPKPTTPRASAPGTDIPRPGWHGCTTCQLVGCLADTAGDVEQLRVRLRFEGAARYTAAILEVSPTESAGAHAVKLDPTGWLPDKEQIVPLALDDLPAMKSMDAWKAAKARLRLTWIEDGKPAGKVIDLSATTLECPR
jgi:hypothetical protein